MPSHNLNYSAHLITVLACVTLGVPSNALGQDKQQECTIAGVVTSKQSSAALSQATIQLNPVGSESDLISEVQRRQIGSPGIVTRSQYTVRSGSDGRFCFKTVQAGRYRMSGRKTGFLETSYGAATPTETGAIMDIGPQQNSDISFALIPQSTISGVVIDAGAEPVDTGSVQVLSKVWMKGAIRYVPVRGARLNDLGEFRVAPLSPGTYYVLFQPPPADPRQEEIDEAGNRIRPVRTFHPATTNLSQAVPIGLGAGENAQNVTIRIQRMPLHRLRGKIVGAIGQTDAAAISISPEDTDATSLVAATGNLGPNNTFDFPDLSPGVYKLTYLATSGRASHVVRGVIAVGDRDVEDARLDVLPPVSIRGRIRVEGEEQPNLTGAQVQLTSIAALVAPSFPAKMQANGTFLVENTSVGKYVMNVSVPAGMYVGSVRYGQTDIKDKEFDVTAGGDEMVITLRNGTAQLEGRIVQSKDPGDSGQGPAAGYFLLVPANLPADGSGLHFGSTDASGTFSLKELPPGSYRAYAFASLDLAAVQSPAGLKAIESFGTDITVNENDKITLTLSVVTADEATRALTRSAMR
jgi:hypothetical protein